MRHHQPLHTLATIFLLGLLAACKPPAGVGPAAVDAEDEKQIRALIGRMEVAWNRGDFRGYMEGFANPDVVFVSRGRIPEGLAGHARSLHPRLRDLSADARHAALLRHQDRDARTGCRAAHQPLSSRSAGEAARRHQHALDAQARRQVGHCTEPRVIARAGLKRGRQSSCIVREAMLLPEGVGQHLGGTSGVVRGGGPVAARALHRRHDE